MASTSVLLWSVLFASIGVGYLTYGRKQRHKMATFSGIGLLLYPYFFNSSVLIVIVGVLLMSLPYVVKL
ncbi:MAG: hypothetical protein R3332_12815 [Pseudohongiellaceae bacterium]|nr:hypothetical protein [Pseudohongiellaceae bacterium]